MCWPDYRDIEEDDRWAEELVIAIAIFAILCALGMAAS